MVRSGSGEAIGQKIRLLGHAFESTEIISCLEGLQFYRNEDRRILGKCDRRPLCRNSSARQEVPAEHSTPPSESERAVSAVPA